MKRQEIIDGVNAIMSKKAGIDINDIKPTDNYDELGADSMQCIEALFEIEKKFVIDIPGSRLFGVNTMQDVYDIVEKIIIETFGFKIY